MQMMAKKKIMIIKKTNHADSQRDRGVISYSGKGDEIDCGYLIHVEATRANGECAIAWVNNTTNEKYFKRIEHRSYDDAAVKAICSALEHAPMRSHLTIACSCRRMIRYGRFELYAQISYLSELRGLCVKLVLVPRSRNLAACLLRKRLSPQGRKRVES